MNPDLTDRIDDVVAGVTADAASLEKQLAEAASLKKQLAGTDTDDVEPNGLEAALRLRLSPQHTNFRNVPTVMVDERSGEHTSGIVACQVIWAVTEGVWSVVSFPCPDSQGLVNIKITGPDTDDVSRRHKTVDQALELLRVLGALPAE